MKVVGLSLNARTTLSLDNVYQAVAPGNWLLDAGAPMVKTHAHKDIHSLAHKRTYTLYVHCLYLFINVIVLVKARTYTPYKRTHK